MTTRRAGASRVAAVALHELRAWCANPSVTGSAASLLLSAWFFAHVMDVLPLGFSATLLAQVGAVGLPSIGTAAALAAARSSGELETLARAGASRAEVVAGRALAAVAASMAVVLAAATLVEARAAVAVAACSLLSVVPAVLGSALAGLSCRDVQQTGGWTGATVALAALLAPVAYASLAPMWWLPFGAAPELVRVLALGGEASAPVAAVVAAGLLWCVVAFVALARRARRPA